MNNPLRMKMWSPYVVGAGIGLLSWFAFLTADRPYRHHLLQKGGASKFHVILGQLLLKDWRVVKIMLTAIAVGSIGVYALVAGGFAELHVKAFQIGGVLIGAVLFGAGLAVFGLCPGTSVAAASEGNRHAMVGVQLSDQSGKPWGPAGLPR